MKMYKIFIPEVDDITAKFAEKYCNGSICVMRGDLFEIERPEIHELVQKHAFELGYNWGNKSNKVQSIDAKHLFATNYGLIVIGFLVDSTNIKKYDHYEISWQDFLTLTSADVSEPPQEPSVPDFPELPEYEKIRNETPRSKYFRFTRESMLSQSEYEQDMRSCEREQRRKHKNEIQKSDRNEKAWDILKVLISRPPYEGIPAMAVKNEDPFYYIKNPVRDAFRYADEFIRQSNTETEEYIKQANKILNDNSGLTGCTGISCDECFINVLKLSKNCGIDIKKIAQDFLNRNQPISRQNNPDQ